MCSGCGNTTRLLFMMILVILYFLVELIVGISIHSIALIADSFHMLSDFLALVVGITATRISKWPRSSKNTFGWQRAEVMGSLINTVVLITLCTTILLRAIERFIEPQAIENTQVMVYVGAGGLAVNILGLIVLGGHSHDGSHQHLEVVEEDHLPSTAFGTPLPVNVTNASYMQMNSVQPNPSNDTYSTDVADGTVFNRHVNSEAAGVKSSKLKESRIRKSHQGSMNMRAVFLHVLADFLGSIIVLLSALILWLVPTNGSWKLYVDPAMSVLMVIIILITAIPLMYKATLILLQSVPSEISIKNLKMRLENIDGIHKIHDLHVWKLQSNCIIGTVHIRCVSLQTMTDYLNIAREVKQLFHEFNIHCTTIQPEFEENPEDLSGEIDYQACVLDCGPNKNCQSDTCCPASAISSPSATTTQLIVTTTNVGQNMHSPNSMNGPAICGSNTHTDTKGSNHETSKLPAFRIV